MKTRYLSVLVLSLVAACAEPPPPEPPPQPTAAPAAPPPTAEATPPAPPPTAEPAPTPPPAPPKPGKEKIVGKWQFSFEGDPKGKAEEEAKKKFPKDKDQAKRDAHLAKIAAEAAGEWIEFADGYYVSHVTVKDKDKVILKVKYDVTKDESGKLGMKANGKDEISKKEVKDMKDELTITFTDDNTISLFDPKKKLNLVFKRK